MAKFNFSDVTDNAGYSLLAPGMYRAKVVDTDEYDKNGGTVYKIVLRVFDGNGGSTLVWDYIKVPNALWKMKQFWAALGVYPDDDGSLEAEPEDYVGYNLEAHVTIQKGNGINPGTGEPYPDRNTVRAYVDAMSGTLSNDNTDIDIDSLF